MNTPSTLGPIACGVLLARDIDSVATAYQPGKTFFDNI